MWENITQIKNSLAKIDGQKHKYLVNSHKKSSTLILNIIAPCMEDLIADVGNKKYSFIIVENTAVDFAKMMCLIIKYIINPNKR